MKQEIKLWFVLTKLVFNFYLHARKLGLVLHEIYHHFTWSLFILTINCSYDHVVINVEDQIERFELFDQINCFCKPVYFC